MKPTPSLVFYLGGLAVFSAWTLLVSGALTGVSTDQLECLFTGLGFVGLVAAFLHERKKSEDEDHDHAELLREMKAQAAALNRATKFQAKVHRLARCEAALGDLQGRAHSPSLEANGNLLRAEVARLQGELDRFSDTDPQ